MANIQKKFHVNLPSVDIVHIDPTKLTDEMPAGVFKVTFNPMAGFGLVKVGDKFDVPAVTFGPLQARADHLMKAYEARGDVSCLLTGDKGAGKTLLAQVFGNMAIEKGKAVILVEHIPDMTAPLRAYLNTIGDAVFIFDEFAKKFGDDQGKMLDFFSGTEFSKRASFVIENSIREVNPYMINRPGRLRYQFSYGKLDPETVVDVCKHFGLSKEAIGLMVDYTGRADTMGMDILNRIIEEFSFAGEPKTKEEFKRIIDVMNIPSNDTFEYEIDYFYVGGQEFTGEGVERVNCHGRDFYMNFHGMENHPLTKYLRENNANFQEAIKRETYEDDGKEVTDWCDITIHSNRSTFGFGGGKVYVIKEFDNLEVHVRLKTNEQLGDTSRFIDL